MNKTSDKDERYPFVHVRTQLMEAVNSDTKLSDAFTELTPEKNKTVALYKMKNKMMKKAQLYNGKYESLHKPGTKPTSQAISVLAHQTGIDDEDILELLINRRDIDPSNRVSSDLFNAWSRDSNRNGLESATHSKRTL
jgi:hypothetical protein